MRSILLSLLLLASCSKAAWVVYPIETPPDRSCYVGVEAVTDFYIWDCLNNEHIVIYQPQSLFGSGKPVRESVACGVKTQIEQETNLEKSCKTPMHAENFEWNKPTNKKGKITR